VTHLAMLAVVDLNDPAAMLANPVFQTSAYAAASPALAIACPPHTTGRCTRPE
jgi:hypothetical protein